MTKPMRPIKKTVKVLAACSHCGTPCVLKDVDDPDTQYRIHELWNMIGYSRPVRMAPPPGGRVIGMSEVACVCSPECMSDVKNNPEWEPRSYPPRAYPTVVEWDGVLLAPAVQLPFGRPYRFSETKGTAHCIVRISEWGHILEAEVQET